MGLCHCWLQRYSYHFLLRSAKRWCFKLLWATLINGPISISHDPSNGGKGSFSFWIGQKKIGVCRGFKTVFERFKKSCDVENGPFTNLSFRGLNPWKHSKIARLYTVLLNQNISLHDLFDACQSSLKLTSTNHPVCCSAGDMDMLSTEGFYHLQKGKVYYSAHLTMKYPH